MKQIVYKGLAVFIYLIFLLYVTGFQLTRVFDAKSFMAVVIGMVLLTFPLGVHRRDKEELFGALAWNAMISGYLTTIIFLFARMNEIQKLDGLVLEIALNCRAVLYGTVFYVIFRGDTGKKNVIDNKNEKEQSGVNDPQNGKSAEEIYFHFRALGLTQREAEVARLLYNGLTNYEIASELYISETTVKKHVSHIFEKLEIEKREKIREFEWQK